MDNVVYILGAGFSAPLGLPVMSNFITMAKDLYEKNKKKYQHFGKVLNSIRERLAYVSWVYDTDLDNIEDILSILVMEQLVGKSSKKELNEYIRFLLDVVNYYTPGIAKGMYENLSPGKVRIVQAGSEEETNSFVPYSDSLPINHYIPFVCNLFTKRFITKGIGEPVKNKLYREFEVQWEYVPDTEENYSVITFNYDLILENIADFVSQVIGMKFKFLRPGDRKSKGLPYLAKLHGSADTGTIIPPTWNKSLSADIDLESLV